MNKHTPVHENCSLVKDGLKQEHLNLDNAIGLFHASETIAVVSLWKLKFLQGDHYNFFQIVFVFFNLPFQPSFAVCQIPQHTGGEAQWLFCLDSCRDNLDMLLKDFFNMFGFTYHNQQRENPTLCSSKSRSKNDIHPETVKSSSFSELCFIANKFQIISMADALVVLKVTGRNLCGR